MITAWIHWHRSFGEAPDVTGTCGDDTREFATYTEAIERARPRADRFHVFIGGVGEWDAEPEQADRRKIEETIALGHRRFELEQREYPELVEWFVAYLEPRKTDRGKMERWLVVTIAARSKDAASVIAHDAVLPLVWPRSPALMGKACPDAENHGVEPKARSGAAQESNLPTAGLRRPTGFEDRLGHQPRPLQAYGTIRRPKNGTRSRQGTSERVRGMQPILDIADLAQRREAAEAVADGAALFYAFGNFCALAAKPDLQSLEAMNRLKGRPLHQVGSVTTTPEKAMHVFDWDRVEVPWSLLVAVMSDLHELGPIGFRGPAAAHIPAHLTVDGTVQLISPGDLCPSNALVSDILDLIGEEVLYITSANTSSHVTGEIEAAHFEIKEIHKEFGHRDDVVLIGHANERANRRRYSRHRACSTSIIAFHEGELMLERLGSLDAMTILEIANRHGLSLSLGAGASIPVPERKASRPSLKRRRTREQRRTTRSLRIHA